jgi:hypothetical protein
MEIAEEREEVEAWILRLGISAENIFYHLWDIFRDRNDDQIRFALPESVFPANTGLHPVVVRSIGANRWRSPWDQSADPAQTGLRCRSLPNGFFFQNYDPADSNHNTPIDLTRINDAKGFTFIVFLPPADGSVARILVIRARVWTMYDGSLRFIKRIDPHLELKDVNGDGNCGYWSILASLQELKTKNLLPSEPTPIVQAVIDRANDINTRHPSQEDYDLMNQLRAATQHPKIKELCERQIIKLKQYLDDSDPSPQKTLGLKNIFSSNPQLPEGFVHHSNGDPNGKTAEDWQAQQLRDIANGAEGSAKNLQERANRAHVSGSTQYWFETEEDGPTLVQAIGLPLFTIEPPASRDIIQAFTETHPNLSPDELDAGLHILKQYRARALEANGDQHSWAGAYSGEGDDFAAQGYNAEVLTADPSAIKPWLQENPSAIKIYGTRGHFNAIVEDK